MLLYPLVLSAICFSASALANLQDAQIVLGLDSANSTQSAPHWVVYGDKYESGVTGPPTADAVEGYNVFILSFLLTEGAWDKAYEWTTLTADERTAIKSEYAAAGIKLLVSAFGSTDIPTTSGVNPNTTAATMAAWVIEYGLDGIDVDYEDTAAMNAGTAEEWLISFTSELRAYLPQDQYIVTHAPVAPWFTPNSYVGGAYTKVHQEVGDLIDWYNIQFYNQGATEYTDCDGLLTASSSTWPETALFQIANNSVDLSKLVIGKPATSSDATNGYMDTSTLATCLETAKNDGWDGGAMVWQYPNADASWISTVRSLSWPV
ncbi:glycoside hydrolase family 18 protein [Guyanagaster necrorhizus]|uniref:Glycoside hydrolase family 18 protein n=1 Tax=Guyanagaster necrorhizus TaxID=856835 RepID=A0A9P8AT70_9AGAR|nr:glycoside hydrolase family 18 protein [Guyanagaster necrorhizus MCA 3950]KAG7445582.1 glycoside hydrolase family 18 protein [Guyanagaster necrorhizus MCA 3950]